MLESARAGAGPELTIRLRAGAGAALVQRLAGPDGFVYGGNRLRIAGGVVELSWPGALLTIDGSSIEGVVDPALLEREGGEEELAQGPLLMALSVALRALGRYHLHAACLVLPEVGTVLVPALSGCGKSTLATALVQAGAAFLGDDTLFVERGAGALRLLALPREFHLTERSALAMGLEPKLAPGSRTLAGKGRLDALGAFPGRFRRTALPPSFILLPRISGEGASRLEPAGPSTALGALLESSALVASRALPGAADHLPVLAGLADGARTFRAELGLDLLSDPGGTARRILGRLAQ
jgi:hypothetical protein